MIKRAAYLTAFLSVVLSSLAVTSLVAQDLIVSEIDYDQVGLDDAEWIEILNTLDIPVPTDSVFVVLYQVDNSGACMEYCRVDLRILQIVPEQASIVVGAHPCAVLPLCTPIDAIPNNGTIAIVIEYLGQVLDGVEVNLDSAESCRLTSITARDSGDVHGSVAYCGGAWSFATPPTPCEANDCIPSDVPGGRPPLWASWALMKRLYAAP